MEIWGIKYREGKEKERGIAGVVLRKKHPIFDEKRPQRDLNRYPF